jgi:transcriptional regulator with PAS, ATPase and Fis domain
MERVALLAEQSEVDSDALALGARTPPVQSLDSLTLDTAEALLVQRALERHCGNLQRAASELGISRQALYRRLEKYNLQGLATDAG